MDKASRSFNIERGVKQGDPLSSLLFNSVTESIIRKLKQKWQNKKWGVQLANEKESLLNNLRFADDIAIIATSASHIEQMLNDMNVETNKVGLELHPDKTKVLHNTHHKMKGR